MIDAKDRCQPRAIEMNINAVCADINACQQCGKNGALFDHRQFVPRTTKFDGSLDQVLLLGRIRNAGFERVVNVLSAGQERAELIRDEVLDVACWDASAIGHVRSAPRHQRPRDVVPVSLAVLDRVRWRHRLPGLVM